MIGANPANITAINGPEAPCLAMRPREAAKALGISARLLWKHTERGTIPHIRLGRAILYPVASLNTWLDQEAQKNTAKDNNLSEK